MFNFGQLPFCTSDTVLFNGEVFDFILYISQFPSKSINIKNTVEMVLSIEESPNKVILL
jgi:hypothetical protein